MPRAILIVMDSVGIGGAADAHKYYNGSTSDKGANTLLNIAKACQAGIKPIIGTTVLLQDDVHHDCYYTIGLLAKNNDGYLVKGIHYNQLVDNNSPFYWNVEKTLEAFENWGAPVAGGAK